AAGPPRWRLRRARAVPTRSRRAASPTGARRSGRRRSTRRSTGRSPGRAAMRTSSPRAGTRARPSRATRTACRSRRGRSWGRSGSPWSSPSTGWPPGSSGASGAIRTPGWPPPPWWRSCSPTSLTGPGTSPGRPRRGRWPWARASPAGAALATGAARRRRHQRGLARSALRLAQELREHVHGLADVGLGGADHVRVEEALDHAHDHVRERGGVELEGEVAGGVLLLEELADDLDHASLDGPLPGREDPQRGLRLGVEQVVQGWLAVHVAHEAVEDRDHAPRAAPALGEVERALHRVPDLVPEHRAEQPVAVADAAIERRARDPDLGGQRLHVEAAAPEVGGVGGFEDGRRYVGRRLRALRNQLGEGLHAALGDG